jgi:hypothetical protein
VKHKDPKFFQCRLCRLAHGNHSEKLTRWFFVSGTTGVVVESLDPGDHPLRLLFVPAQHKPTGKETFQMRGMATQLLAGVATAIAIEAGYKIAGYDLNIEHDHWYAQATLDWA